MKKHLKKILSLTLALCFMVTPFALVADAATNEDAGVMPCLNNTASVTTNMSISSSGKLTVSYRYNGFDGITTKAVITTYVEKRFLGIFWSRVDIGTTDNEWVDTVYDYIYTGSRTHQLSDSGTYRVTVQYKIYGSGGAADVIDYEGTDSY